MYDVYGRLCAPCTCSQSDTEDGEKLKFVPLEGVGDNNGFYVSSPADMEGWEIAFGQLVTRAWSKGLWHSESELHKSLKSFIRSLIRSAEERAVAEHDAKWHPINKKMEMENCHEAVSQREDEILREVEKMRKDCPAHGHSPDDNEERGECYGYDETYNQALSDLQTIINKKRTI